MRSSRSSASRSTSRSASRSTGRSASRSTGKTIGLTGFLIASLNPAPPVYDPGGLSCVIDDFAVASADDWLTTAAFGLLRAALAEAGQRRAVQAVVVTAHLDEPKRQALGACGLQVASEWWVTPQGLRSG